MWCKQMLWLIKPLIESDCGYLALFQALLRPIGFSQGGFRFLLGF